MQLFDPNNPNERKKAVAAAALAVAAIAVLGYVFFGGSGSTNKPVANLASPRPTPRPSSIAQTGPAVPDDLSILRPVALIQPADGGESNRNIFAYYEPPPVPSPTPKIVVPSPTPTPPVMITSVSPSQVFARTADFKLQVMGDKFTPAVKIIIDGRDLPTQFVNSQQIAATVPASFISTPGPRNVTARSNDGVLYSNQYQLNVSPPPVPNYTYIGIIGKPHANDIALLVEKGSKELLNVQRGDVLGGRFRVTSISERELILTDTILKIKHPLAFTVDTSNPNTFRPGPRQADDEP